MTNRRESSAFTLLELILVMVIACTALAVAAPSLSGWSRGAKMRDTADQFIAVTRWAHLQKDNAYRLTIDAQNGTYRLTVKSGEGFAPLQNSWGRAFQLPESVHIELVKDQAAIAQQQTGPNQAANEGDESSIDFFSTGRVQPAHVRLSSDRGETIDIECPSPAEGFVITSSSGGSQ